MRRRELTALVHNRLAAQLRTPPQLWPPRSWAGIERLLGLYNNHKPDRPGVWCLPLPLYTAGWGTL